ncbi:hypothetical protein H9P43_005915 [Blastocladiella emersonii ATCC 22665]|nr:hypothetical protein H9P43_005915 [Blastocladiella emersonii ATCC 22665]
MGQGQSKPAPEPIVFTSDVSVRFNENLIRKLEANTHASSSASTAPSTVEHAHAAAAPAAEPQQQPQVDPAELEAAIQAEVSRRVAEELEHRRGVEGSRADNREHLDATAAQREADELLHRLGRISLPTPEPNLECVAAQDALAACFKANARRPLDCWREVDQFKGALKKVQREFMETASML